MSDEVHRRTSVILNSPGDWRQWIMFVKDAADTHGIWKYIDPDTDMTLDEPASTEAMIAEAMSTIMNPNVEDKMVVSINSKLPALRLQQELYKSHLRAMGEVRKQIRETIHRDLLVKIRSESTVKGMLIKLRDSMSYTNRRHKQVLLQRYDDLRKGPKGNMGAEQWARKWENLYDEAKDMAVIGFEDIHPYQEFVRTAYRMLPNFCSFWETQLYYISNGTSHMKLPEFNQFISDFIAQARNSREIERTRDRSNGAAFSTFGNQPEATPENKAESERKDQSKDMPKNQDSGTQRNAKNRRQCPCGDVDTAFEECKYVNPEKRQATWKADPKVIEEFMRRCQFQGFKRALTKALAKHNRTIEDLKNEAQVSSKSVNHVHFEGLTYSTFNNNNMPMKNAVLYDTGSNQSVFNNVNDFIELEPREFSIGTGESETVCLGIGKVMFKPTSPCAREAEKGFMITNVAYSPGMHTNIVSASQLKKQGTVLDMNIEKLVHGAKPICSVRESNGLYWIKWEQTHAFATTQIAPKKASKKRSTEPKRLKGTYDVWHARLGHIGFEALRHLTEATTGTVMTTDKPNPMFGRCEECHLATSNRQFSRVPVKPGKTFFEKVHLDLMPMSVGFNGDKWILHFYCDLTGFHAIIPTPDKSVEQTAINFLVWMKKQWDCVIKVVHCDNERALGKAWSKHLKKEDIRNEPTVVHTPEQNGHIERAGALIMKITRALCYGGRLPMNLWPELARTAVYILNRIPTKKLGWKTPWEAMREVRGHPGEKPYLGHIYQVGARAYVRRDGIPRSEKVEPRAKIGYLVGFDAFNIWRIWMPDTNEVIRARDVVFDETKRWHPNEVLLTQSIRQQAPEVITTYMAPNGEEIHEEADVEEAYALTWCPTPSLVDERQEGQNTSNNDVDMEESNSPWLSNPGPSLYSLAPQHDHEISTKNPLSGEPRDKSMENKDRCFLGKRDEEQSTHHLFFNSVVEPQAGHSNKADAAPVTASSKTDAAPVAAPTFLLNPVQQGQRGLSRRQKGLSHGSADEIRKISMLKPGEQPQGGQLYDNAIWLTPLTEQQHPQQNASQDVKTGAAPEGRKADIEREKNFSGGARIRGVYVQGGHRTSPNSAAAGVQHHEIIRDIDSDQILGDIPLSPPDTPSQGGKGGNEGDSDSEGSSESDETIHESTRPRDPKKIAPKDINLEFSENNIVEGPRIRKRSDRALSTPSPPRRSNIKRQKRANFVNNRMQRGVFMVNSFMAAMIHEKRMHLSELPPPPKNWKKVLNHPCREGFLKAAQIEIDSLVSKQTWKRVSREVAKTSQILPVIWVFTYKFDEDGYLTKYKARLCVRGDLQWMTRSDTKAATLAARTFRMMMALAAAYDLEIWQADAVNAFVNSKLDEEVYIECPEGYRTSGIALQLIRALYGLRRAPRLWQKNLSSKLVSMGFMQIAEDECLFTKNGIIVFFFVDDLVALYNKKQEQEFQEFKSEITKAYKFREMENFEWFLGIRIIRDRQAKKIWILQDSYIDKIVSKYGLGNRHVETPISKILKPNEGKASAREIHEYQERIGSALYLAVMTRPDAAKAVQVLSQFNLNPSPVHREQAERVIEYYNTTRSMAIEYSAPNRSQEPNYEPVEFYTDAAFADNEDRKSSEGYLMKLYGGPVDWKATKQKTVTTSTTEAELLSLSHGGKCLMVWIRMFNAINFDPEHQLYLKCDNKQTVKLMMQEEPPLNTNLKHVDIMQHWLRQEVAAKRLTVRWVPTAEQTADGLTKILPGQQFHRFVKQLSMIDITHYLQE